MTRELSEIALRHAVREKVFPEAQPSVLKAVELFWKFVEKHQWKGKSLSPGGYELASGLVIKVEPIGRYFSQHTKSEWVVSLQPRQDDIPSDEQFSMWRSALSYTYCTDTDAAMIVDLSKNTVSQKRQLREITRTKFRLLAANELNERLELVAACYRKATELIPERPSRPKLENLEPDFGF